MGYVVKAVDQRGETLGFFIAESVNQDPVPHVQEVQGLDELMAALLAAKIWIADGKTDNDVRIIVHTC